MANRRGLTVGIATAAIGLAIAGGFYAMANRGPRLAPDFVVSDLQGRTVRLSALRGKVVLVNLWTTWCPPCVEEMPSMERLHARLAGDDFVLLAVSEDEEGRRVVQPFVERLKLSLPIFLDPDRQVGDRYGVTGYPETFVIDRNGYIVERVIGPRDWSSPQALSGLSALLAAGGRAASPPAPGGPS